MVVMKRGFILILLVLTSSFVIGNIDVSVDKDKYNFGEDISISGKISNLEVDKEWYVEPELICGSDSIKFIGSMMQYPLISGQEIFIPSGLEIFPIKTGDSTGDCRIKLTIIDEDSSIVEDGLSESFIITKALIGSFEIDKKTIQLGDKLTITGDIKKVDGTSINGVVNIILVDSSDKRWIVSQSDIQDGRVGFESNFEGTSILNNPGVYEINVFSKDIYGNEKLFNIGSVEFVDEISVYLKSNKVNFLPGEEVNIVGEAKTILQEDVENADVIIKFNQNTYKTSIKEREFNYIFIIPEDNPSGKQTVFVNIKDSMGNKGESSVEIYVKAVPEKISFRLNKESVNPQENIEIIPLLHDQAGDLIFENLDVKILNNEGEELYSSIVKCNEKIIFDIGQFDEPGEWVIEASVGELKKSESFIVKEIKDIEIKLANQTLYITNTGNVEYEDLLRVEFSSGEYSFKKKTSIMPSETIVVDLSEEAPTGSYDVSIKGAAIDGGVVDFSNVKVVGKETKSFNFFYSILIMFLLACFVYLLIFKRKMIRGAKLKEDRIFKKAKEDKEKFVKIKEEKEKKRPITFENREASIKDFRKRVLKEIRETENKQKPSTGFGQSNTNDQTSNQEPKKEGGGLFNMFDR